MPHGFLSHVKGHTKVLPVYLMEEGWYQALHPDYFLQVMHDGFTQLLLLCPPMGFFTGYPPPIGPVMTSLHFLPRPCLLWLSHPIRDVPAQTPLCTCAMHPGQITPAFIPVSAFERVSNSSSLNSCTPNTLYTTVHVSQVSEYEGCPASFFVHI